MSDCLCSTVISNLCRIGRWCYTWRTLIEAMMIFQSKASKLSQKMYASLPLAKNDVTSRRQIVSLLTYQGNLSWFRINKKTSWIMYSTGEDMVIFLSSPPNIHFKEKPVILTSDSCLYTVSSAAHSQWYTSQCLPLHRCIFCPNAS